MVEGRFILNVVCVSACSVENAEYLLNGWTNWYAFFTIKKYLNVFMDKHLFS